MNDGDYYSNAANVVHRLSHIYQMMMMVEMVERHMHLFHINLNFHPNHIQIAYYCSLVYILLPLYSITRFKAALEEERLMIQHRYFVNNALLILCLFKFY